MKKIYAVIFPVLLIVTFCDAQTIINQQYASSVIAVSSEYSPTPGSSYNSSQMLGAPNVYPNCGDNGFAWAPSTANGQREFFVLGFATPQQVNTIRIYQNYGPGAVDTVYLRDAISGVFNKVYEATATNGVACPGLSQMLLEIQIPATSYNVDAIRVAINSPANTNLNEFDAVAIANFSRMNFAWVQYASSVISFSSQYSSTNWSAQKALGPPNVYPNCGDIAEAWASASADGSREFLELGFSYPAHVNRVTAYQTLAPGAIDTIYLRNASTQAWIKIFDQTASSANCPSNSALEINFTETSYDVDAVRIAVNSPAVSNWNEIDAVSIQSNLPPNAKFTTKTGNWSDNTTWSDGVIPTANDTVVIGSGHTIALDVNGFAKSLIVGSNGMLNATLGNQLTIGPTGGGKELLQVQGGLNLTSGIVNVNGHADFLAGSSFNMSGGQLVVDGNDGTDAGSVVDGIPLINFQAGMSTFSVTDGTVTIVDPQFHASGQALTGNYTFTGNSTVKMGDGISTTAGNDPYGFGGTATFPVLRNFILDAVTGAGNRQFKVGNTVTVTGNTTISSGTLQPNYDFVTNNDLLNNATILLDGGVRVLNDLTNNGTITMGTSPGHVAIGNNFTNNGTYSVTTTYTSVGNNLVNNGTLNVFWLYFANNFGVTTNAQTIGGPGIFNIYGIEMVNANVNGVTMLLPLHVEFMYWVEGKLFIGDNDLTVNQYSYGNSNVGNYVVTNGNGRYINNNINGSPVTIPIGTNTSYTPVILANGSSHTFAASVKAGVVSGSPTSTSVVHREWNISDLTGGAVSADVTFQWNGSDEDPSFNRNVCYVSHFAGGVWHAVTPPGAASGTDPYTRTATGVSSFSPFALASNGALPVHLLSFDAVKNGSVVKINWTTTDEINLAAYELERSTDGIAFSKINAVNARRLAARQEYQITDAAPVQGKSFYRLKMINDDATFSYSKVVKVDMNADITIHIFPNPARNTIHIQGASHLISIQLLDLSGRILKEWKKPSAEDFDLGRISGGIYQVRMISKDATLTEQLVISQ